METHERVAVVAAQEVGTRLGTAGNARERVGGEQAGQLRVVEWPGVHVRVNLALCGCAKEEGLAILPLLACAAPSLAGGVYIVLRASSEQGVCFVVEINRGIQERGISADYHLIHVIVEQAILAFSEQRVLRRHRLTARTRTGGSGFFFIVRAGSEAQRKQAEHCGEKDLFVHKRS